MHQDTRAVTLEELVDECTNDLLNDPDYSKQLDIVERIQAQGKDRSRARYATACGGSC